MTHHFSVIYTYSLTVYMIFIKLQKARFGSIEMGVFNVQRCKTGRFASGFKWLSVSTLKD